MRKFCCFGVELHHIAQKFAHDARGLGVGRAGRGDFDGIIAEIRQLADRAAACRRWRGDWRPCAARLWEPARRFRLCNFPFSSNSSSGGSSSSNVRESSHAPDLFDISPIGTWCDRQLSSVILPSTVFGPVQPLGDSQNDHRPDRAFGLNPFFARVAWIV